MSEDDGAHDNVVNFPKPQRLNFGISNDIGLLTPTSASDDILLLGSKSSHRLRSRLVAPKDILIWHNEIQHTKWSLKKLVRDDCLGGKGMFHIFCLECDNIYHRCGTNKPREACAYFLRSHINSNCHLKAYEKHLDLIDVSKANNDVEDTIQANKIQIANAI